MILSPGRRIEILEYFKEELREQGGRVLAIDIDPYAPALYVADKAFCIEKDFSNPEPYMMEVLDLCRKEGVDLILTLIDPELPLLAEYRERFTGEGIRVLLSDKGLIEATLDKYLFYKTFCDLLPLLPTWETKEEAERALTEGRLSYPVFAKPRRGSGSAGLALLSDKEDWMRFEPAEDYIYQPCKREREYGADLYFNLHTGRLDQCFLKEKIAMRSGETDKAVSIHQEEILKIAHCLEGRGFYGVVDMDLFLGPDGSYYVNEINPRFGGGYPHAHHCGMNYIKCILKDLAGEGAEGSFLTYEDGLVMMKYNHYFFMKKEETKEKERR